MAIILKILRLFFGCWGLIIHFMFIKAFIDLHEVFVNVCEHIKIASQNMNISSS